MTNPDNRSQPRPGAPCHSLAAGAHPPAIVQDVADAICAKHSYGAKAGNAVGMINPVIYPSAVRRLTPRECERLQGLPDDHTLIRWRGKLAADSPRYKAIGNAMPVPVMRWVMSRIEFVDGVLKHLAQAEAS